MTFGEFDRLKISGLYTYRHGYFTIYVGVVRTIIYYHIEIIHLMLPNPYFHPIFYASRVVVRLSRSTR